MNADTKQLKREYYAARKELEQLEGELPNFETLLTENGTEELKLRTGKAPLAELAAARSRVSAAHALLEQHQSDIATARAEAERLEGLYQHALTFDKMTENARDATKHRAEFDTAILEANRALEPIIEKLYSTWRALNQARYQFLTTGRSLSRGFGVNSWPFTMTHEQVHEEETRMNAVLEDIRARGVDLTEVLAPHDGRRASMADAYHYKDLARPEPYAPLLWRAISHKEQERHQEAERQHRTEESERRARIRENAAQRATGAKTN
jgi:hypothetical protein